MCTSPIRQISDNLTFQFLPVCSTSASTSTMCDLHEQLDGCSSYQHLQVEQYCLMESSQKYSFMKEMKSSGFPFPTALVTYTHGNNIGNLNFMWKVQSNDESAFSDSQAVIEQLKQWTPTYHTRAMRKRMLQEFGRLTSSVAPAVMRLIYRSLTGMHFRWDWLVVFSVPVGAVCTGLLCMMAWVWVYCIVWVCVCVCVYIRVWVCVCECVRVLLKLFLLSSYHGF